MVNKLIDKINSLRQKHYICEDCWYSCPKVEGEDSCCDESKEFDDCNCGADKTNNIIDEIIYMINNE